MKGSGISGPGFRVCTVGALEGVYTALMPKTWLGCFDGAFYLLERIWDLGSSYSSSVSSWWLGLGSGGSSDCVSRYITSTETKVNTSALLPDIEETYENGSGTWGPPTVAVKVFGGWV